MPNPIKDGWEQCLAFNKLEVAPPNELAIIKAAFYAGCALMFNQISECNSGEDIGAFMEQAHAELAVGQQEYMERQARLQNVDLTKVN